MTEPSNPIETVSAMRLDDDEAERLINLMDYRDRRSGYSGPSGLAIALRSRIRHLVEEARLQAGKDLVHVLTRSADK